MRTGVIAAISTPPGKGGVAIIRLSGEGTLELAERVFTPISKKSLSDYPPRSAIYGYVKDGEDILDDCILTLFPAPASYTGEDVAELSIHGGVLLTRTVLELLFRMGAIPAEAGEFTRRAFINGKLTLTDAEAIGLLLEAKSEEQLRLAEDNQRELLRGAIESIRASLTDTLSSIYARIDYPEEDLGDFTDGECLERLKNTEAALLCLTSTYRTGRAIAEGVDTVICGRPNVGKSTLYNLLLGYDAAIVTDIPGTTRDTLSATVSLGRATLNLSDTAGIRGGENIDAVEKIGIMRSRENIRRAELILALFDLSSLPDEEDFALLCELRECSGAKICIFTKSDLDCTDTKYRDAIAGTHFDAVISISAKAKPEDALAELEKTVSRLFIDEELLPSKSAIVATARQHAALLRALDFIGSAKLALESGIPQDAASSDIELSLGAISELDGRAVADSVVSDIFSKFCVGK